MYLKKKNYHQYISSFENQSVEIVWNSISFKILVSKPYMDRERKAFW